jgi:FkbM family methyltransferase
MLRMNLRSSMDLGAILALLCSGQGKPYFMQVGAFDGSSNDVLYPYIRKFRLHGVLIEPQPNAFRALLDTYKDMDSELTFVCAAVDTHDRTRVLYTVSGPIMGHPWLPQIASLKRSMVLRHAKQVPNLREYIVPMTVQCVSFETIFARIGRISVDILCLDAEGLDGVLLRAFKVPIRKPSVIVFEHKHLLAGDYLKLLKLLSQNRYEIGLLAGSDADTVAYRRGYIE